MADLDQPSRAAQPQFDGTPDEDSDTSQPVLFSLSDDGDHTADDGQAESALSDTYEAVLTDRADVADLKSTDANVPAATGLPEPIVISDQRDNRRYENGSDQSTGSLQWIEPVTTAASPEVTAPSPEVTAPSPEVAATTVPTVAEPQPTLIAPPTVKTARAAQPIAEIIYRDEPVVTAPVATAETSLHDTRYRPPVAVTQIPVSIGRGESDESASIIRPTVTPVQAPRLDQPAATSGGIAQENLTPLYMSRTQIRSLTIGGKLKGVKVDNQDICQAFAAGTNELKLIGTGNGVTQLVVWAETASGDKTLMRAFEVHVADAVAVGSKALEQRTAMLNQSIAKMFPGCNVDVTRDGDQLLVRGRCDSDAAAKKIIRIVRKTCVVPVRDELEIR